MIAHLRENDSTLFRAGCIPLIPFPVPDVGVWNGYSRLVANIQREAEFRNQSVKYAAVSNRRFFGRQVRALHGESSTGLALQKQPLLEKKAGAFWRGCRLTGQ
jgi:hypothetical protein